MEAAANAKGKFAKWWESISPKLDEAVQVTKEKADEFSKIGKLKYEIFQMRRVLLKSYQELGEHTFKHAQDHKGDPMTDIDDMLASIQEMRLKVAEMENEIINLQCEDEK